MIQRPRWSNVRATWSSWRGHASMRRKKEKLLTEKYKAKVLASGGTLPGIAPAGSGAASSSAGPSSSNLGADGQAAAAPDSAAGMAQSLLSGQVPTGGADMAQSLLS